MKILDITDQLPHHPNKRYRSRKESSITHIVIHHSATRKGTPQQFARWHVEKGWPGIGYHYVVARNGVIWKTNPILRTTYHCRGLNSRSIGICLIGNFNEQRPSHNQLDVLEAFIIDVQRAFERHLTIIPHSAVCATSCPGRHLQEWLKEHYS